MVHKILQVSDLIFLISYDIIVAEPTWIIPAQVRESTLEGSNVLQTV
jgi:hypothetical protein